MTQFRRHHAVWPAFAGALLLAMLLSTGCGSSKQAETVRNLRLAGQADSARSMALSLLNENANRMDLWLEFARSSLDAVRLRPNTEDEDHTNDLNALVQAALVCSAVYQQAKHEPPKEWRDTGKLVSAEVARQVNNVITAMNAQMQSALYLKPMLHPTGPDSLMSHGSDVRAEQLLVNYRMGARNLLFWSTVMHRLLESLPEVNPGTASLLAGQLEEARTPWAQSLDLDPAYMSGTQQRARQVIDEALQHALQDYRDLGYLLPQTITENGVSQ